MKESINIYSRRGPSEVAVSVGGGECNSVKVGEFVWVRECERIFFPYFCMCVHTSVGLCLL